MKYFTLSWWLNYGTSNDNKPVEEYWKYVDSIRSRLPAKCVEFLEHYTLHDSEITSRNIDIVNHEVELKCEGWGIDLNHKTKYHLKYKNAESFRIKIINPEEAWGLPGIGDIGYDEFDLQGALFEHRLLTAAGVEISIVFGDLQFSHEK